MSVQQNKQVVPPIPTDTRLSNFSQIIQSNLVQLFQAAHVHKVVDAPPKPNDGGIGDVYLGDLATGKYVYIKFKSGWYTVALTAL